MIERGSDKHGPRLDDAMEHEVEGLVRGDGSTHAEEWKEPEPAGEDQSAAESDLELRSELAAHLRRTGFPTDVSGLLDQLIADNAPDRLRALVRRLPTGRV